MSAGPFDSHITQANIPVHDRSVVTPHRRVVAIIAFGYVVTATALIGIGLFLTKVIDGSGLMKWDERTIENFAAHRTPSQNRLSLLWSRLADAPSIGAVALLVMVGLALFRRWRMLLHIATVIALELGTFLTISYIVGRARPAVEHLGSLPSTGSFPSGHVAVTLAFYGTLAFLVQTHHANKVWGGLLWAYTLVATLFVAWARMYRGMHHPLDVLAGAALGLAIWWTCRLAFAQRQHRHVEVRE